MENPIEPQRPGCEYCRWAPLTPAQLNQIGLDLGAREVRATFSIDQFADLFVAIYQDGTYQGIEVDRALTRTRDLARDPAWVGEALRKAPRHERQANRALEFERY